MISGKHLRALLLLALSSMVSSALATTHIVIVSGLGGETRFQDAFDSEALAIYRAAETLNADTHSLHLLTGDQANREHLLATLEMLQPGANDQLQLHLIGHGSWDGMQYKFNLVGPDLTADDLAANLNQLGGEQLVALMTSSSGAALEPLTSDNRVVITATKSGLQKNLSLFSSFWAEGVTSELADLDKNEIIDLDELYQFTRNGITNHYEESGLIASESSLVEGSELDRFTISRVGLLAGSALDAETEALLVRRDSLESQLDELATRRDDMSEADYFEALQEIILQLGQIQNQIDMRLEMSNEGLLE